jgi:hypothetical protein
LRQLWLAPTRNPRPKELIMADGTGTLPEDTQDKKRKPRSRTEELPLDARKLQAILKGIHDLKVQDILPDELAFAVLQAHMHEVQSLRKADKAALVGRKGKVRTLAEMEQDAADFLRRLERLLSGTHALGSVGRVDFFPAGPGPHDELARLDAFLHGWHKRPLKEASVPADLKRDKVVALREDLRKARDEKQSAVTRKLGTGPASVATSTQTRNYQRQLTDFLRGFYGDSSPVLASFGIKVRRGRG